MQIDNKIGVRRFGLVNWIGVTTLVKREIMRFLAVWNQTIAAPMVTSGLFLFIFNIAVGPNRGLVMGYSYIIFMVPGIVMMSIIQNAFANTSSSIMTSKIQGNIVDTLMPPLSAGEMLAGYVLGGIVRGLFVAIGLWLGCAFVLGVEVAHPLLALAFTIAGAGFLSSLGLLAGIYAQKYDQMSAITNFIITPLAFLSGSFYSITALPEVLQKIALFNPIFYLIDGLRFSVLGVSDTPVLPGLMISLICFFATGFAAWWMLLRGYRLKP